MIELFLHSILIGNSVWLFVLIMMHPYLPVGNYMMRNYKFDDYDLILKYANIVGISLGLLTTLILMVI